MIASHMTDTEVAMYLAAAVKAARLSPNGANMSQQTLARHSGIGLTSLKRFEATGAITLGNLVAILRTLGALDGLMNLLPDPDAPGPLDILAAEEKKARSKRMRAKRNQHE